jgi:hypothetical protein
MTIIACCGHDVTDKEQVEVEIMDFYIDYDAEEIKNGVTCGLYCKSCSEEFERWGIVLHNQEQKDNWFSGKMEYPEIAT